MKNAKLVRSGKSSAAKTAASVPAVVPVPTSMDTLMAHAATVTPDSFGAELRRVNAGHGVTHGARNVNRFDATRIEYTQNATFNRNTSAQLSDVQLLFVWAASFPMATGRVFDVNRATDDATMRVAIVNGCRIVHGARATFNAGKHGCPAPAAPSVRYGSPRVAFAPAPTPVAPPA